MVSLLKFKPKWMVAHIPCERRSRILLHDFEEELRELADRKNRKVGRLFAVLVTHSDLCFTAHSEGMGCRETGANRKRVQSSGLEAPALGPANGARSGGFRIQSD